MTAELQDLGPVIESEKALEQDYFDQAKAALDKAVAERSGPSSAGTAFERRSYNAVATRRQVLGADEPVAFGRIDLDDADVRYVGKVPIRDSTGEVLVYNWQSPAADPYNAATHDDPRGVARKRVFDAPRNLITSFEDTLFRQLADGHAPLEEFSSANDPLLEELGRGRGKYMQDMVRTIAAAQSKLIRSDKDQLLIIQGGPGTGKTAVALHRVSYLFFNHQDELQPQDVLVVGPNPTFTKYIQRVLPDLGDENVVQQSLSQLLGGSVTAVGVDESKVARLKGSATMSAILSKALYQRVRVPSTGLKIRRRYSATTQTISGAAIQQALKALKPGTFNERRATLRTAMIRESTKPVGLFRSADPMELLDPASVESELDKVWPQLSPQQFVRELYGSRDRLRAAGASDPQVAALYRPMAARTGDEPWTAADLAVLDQAMHLIQGVENTYGHILVDEAQDLSVMQLQAIRRRSRSGSMTIVGDIAQSTSAYARPDWSQVQNLLASDLPTNLEELSVGYRVPRQVFDVAAKVLEVAAPRVTAPQVFRDVAESPRWLLAKDSGVGELALRAVQDHSAKGLFVGVIANQQLWPELHKSFNSCGLKWSESTDGGLSQGINLVTPEDSKGLEFDAVVVVDPQRILRETQGARLLYVALTRTIHYLDVVIPTGKVPDILAEFVPARPGPVQALHHGENQKKSAIVEQILPPQEVAIKPTVAAEVQAVDPSCASGGKAIQAGSLIASTPLAKLRDEEYAVATAEEIYADLRQSAGPAVQHRVVELLKEMVGSVID